MFSSNTPYEIKVNGKKIKSHSDYEVVYDRVENDEYVLGIKIKGVGNAQLRFSSKNEAKELGWIINESKKSARKSLKEEKATDSLFEDVVFSMIKKFKLKKEYDVERPSWSVFNFRHKNKDAQFAITFDERGHCDFLYGEVLAFGDEKDDIFKYKTDEVKINSYNIEKECSNIIADCLIFIDTNKKITIFESKKSVRKSLKEYLVKGLDVDFVVDHLLSLEDPDNFDLINELGDLWELYKKSWNKFNKSLSDFWEVMKDIEKLDSFDKTCKEIIDAWYDDIEKIFYSDDNLENLKLNYGFEGNDVF